MHGTYLPTEGISKGISTFSDSHVQGVIYVLKLLYVRVCMCVCIEVPTAAQKHEASEEEICHSTVPKETNLTHVGSIEAALLFCQLLMADAIVQVRTFSFGVEKALKDISVYSTVVARNESEAFRVDHSTCTP